MSRRKAQPSSRSLEKPALSSKFCYSSIPTSCCKKGIKQLSLLWTAAAGVPSVALLCSCNSFKTSSLQPALCSHLLHMPPVASSQSKFKQQATQSAADEVLQKLLLHLQANLPGAAFRIGTTPKHSIMLPGRHTYDTV